MRRVVFLDRDGTLNQEVGYLHRIEDFAFIPGAVEAIRLFNQEGYMVAVVTNQAGVAKGFYGEKEVVRLHRYIQSELKRRGAWIDQFCYCPYHVDAKLESYRKESECRKPGIGMLQEVEREHGIEKRASWMVGDAASDILAGKRFGIRTILVSTGYGRKTYADGNCQPDYFVKDILEAAALIVSENGTKEWEHVY